MATMAIAFISMGVWAHHMFTVGMSRTLDLYFVAASLLVSIPTGIKFFNWLATMYGGRLSFASPMLFSCEFLSLFLIGGLTGIMLATAPFDFQLSDSYFVVGHFHWILIGGTLFGTFAGIHYWYPKVTGRMLSERLARWQFWLLYVGFILTFAPMHVSGMLGMPRRIYTYEPDRGWAIWNQIATLGAIVQAPSFMIFLVNVVKSLFDCEPAGDDPWDAWTLEWTTTSPPPAYNFETIPRSPVADRSGTGSTLTTRMGSTSEPPMTTHSVLASAPAFEPQLTPGQWGMAAFLVSEGALFSTLIVVYLAFVGRDTVGPTPREALSLPLVFGTTLCLLSSSYTIHQAEKRLTAGDPAGFRKWWLTTIALGVVFLLGTADEWFDLITHDKLTIGRNLFGSTFYTLIGFHGFHVTVGLITMLLVLLFRPRPGSPGVGLVSWYWHFVDGVWVIVFSVVYLGTR